MLTRMIGISTVGFCAMGICAISTVGGCSEPEPSQPYNRNMSVSESGRQLLPVARTVAGSRDPSILDNAQADIIRRDEIDTPEAMEMINTPSPSAAGSGANTIVLTEATNPAEALSNVGKAFFGNLAGMKVKGAGIDNETSDSSEGSASAGGAGEADARKVLKEYSQELAAGRYLQLSALCASNQRSNAGAYFVTLDEMNTSLASLLAAYEKSSPGVKVKFQQMLSNKRSAPSIDRVDINGASATISVSGGDGTTSSISMMAEDGSWRVIQPVVAAASDWSSLEDELDSQIETLDDEVSELTGGGTADASKLDKLIEETIDYLSAMPK